MRRTRCRAAPPSAASSIDAQVVGDLDGHDRSLSAIAGIGCVIDPATDHRRLRVEYVDQRVVDHVVGGNAGVRTTCSQGPQQRTLDRAQVPEPSSSRIAAHPSSSAASAARREETGTGRALRIPRAHRIGGGEREKPSAIVTTGEDHSGHVNSRTLLAHRDDRHDQSSVFQRVVQRRSRWRAGSASALARAGFAAPSSSGNSGCGIDAAMRGHRRHAWMSVTMMPRAPSDQRSSMTRCASRRSTIARTAIQPRSCNGDTVGDSMPGVSSHAWSTRSA